MLGVKKPLDQGLFDFTSRNLAGDQAGWHALIRSLFFNFHPLSAVAGSAFQTILAAVDIPLIDHRANRNFHPAASTKLGFDIPVHHRLLLSSMR